MKKGGNGVTSVLTSLYRGRAELSGDSSVFFFFIFIYFLAALGLRCCAQAFSGAALRCRAQASHCGGFSCCGARALGPRASVVVALRLSSCGSRALERRLSSFGARA